MKPFEILLIENNCCDEHLTREAGAFLRIEDKYAGDPCPGLVPFGRVKSKIKK
jgi:hypothetical protein